MLVNNETRAFGAARVVHIVITNIERVGNEMENKPLESS